MLRELLSDTCVISIASPRALENTLFLHLCTPSEKKKGPLQSWKIHPPGHCCLFLGLHCPEKQLTDGINMYESPKHEAWPTPAITTQRVLLSYIVSCQPPGDWDFPKDKEVFIHFFFCADKSVHVSNLQHIGVEVAVSIWSQTEREECLQLWKSLGLINAWENITTSALSFLLWHEACQASLKLLTHAKSNTAFLLFCSPHGNTPLLVSNILHWATGPYIVKMWSLIFT